MNKAVIIIVLVFILTGSMIFLNQSKPEKVKDIIPKPSVSVNPITEKDEVVDFRASFAIFTNGTFRIFTAPMYHNQSEDVFIEGGNPNIIQVKKSGITWNDFFTTLPFKLTKDCLTTGTGQTFCTPLRQGSAGQAKLRFYLNGKEDPNALDKKIVEGDQLLVTFGNETDEQINLHLNQIPSSKR